MPASPPKVSEDTAHSLSDRAVPLLLPCHEHGLAKVSNPQTHQAITACPVCQVKAEPLYNHVVILVSRFFFLVMFTFS